MIRGGRLQEIGLAVETREGDGAQRVRVKGVHGRSVMQVHDVHAWLTWVQVCW